MRQKINKRGREGVNKRERKGKSDQNARPLPACRSEQEVVAEAEGRADTEEHIFPLPFSFAFFSPAASNRRRKKKGKEEAGFSMEL